MQTRTITVDYARPRGYDVGYRAENNFTLLALPIPAELEGADSYRVYFESTVGEYLQTELLTPTDGYVTVKITSDIVPEPGNMAAQLVAFRAGEIVGYAPMITGSAKVSIPDGTERLSHSLAAEIALNTAARHSHDNKSVLDKFAETDGKPTYDGEVLGGGGASDFTIKMAVASGEDGYTVTSCDATVEQIDAAVAAEKRVVLIATDTASGLFWEMPIIFGSQGNSYEFGTFLEGQVIVSFVDKVGENESKWQFMLTKIAAEAVDYSNAALPYVSTVGEALDKLVPNSHTHANKGTLDKLSDVNGKLQYNGSDVGLKGEKGDTGASGASGSPGTDGITPRIGTNGNWYLGDTDTGKPSRGDKGDKGADGKDGVDGSPGAAGADGVTPAIGENGNWFVGNTDTGKPSRGEKGDPGKDGVDGSPGAAGADGVTPHIGDNGNWFVGNTDTGKPSRGATGAKGSDGANGKNGAQGEKGADGKTPVRGTDYWTAADKQEIVNSVIAALPDGTEVSY